MTLSYNGTTLKVKNDGVVVDSFDRKGGETTHQLLERLNPLLDKYHVSVNTRDTCWVMAKLNGWN